MRGYPALYRGVTFNENVDGTGAPVLAKAQDAVVIDRARITPQIRNAIDPLHVGLGATLGAVHKGPLYIQLAGRILVPDTKQRPTFGDRQRTLMATFDPDLCYLAAPVTDGAFPLTYTEDTADTGAFPSGRIALQRWARPVQQPTIDETMSGRGSYPYALSLVCGDPRAYGQTALALALSAGTPSGNLTNLGTSRAPVKATITMSAAGASNFTLTVAGVPLVLNLTSLIASDVIVVVGETCAPFGEGRLITRNGSRAASLKTSGATSWPQLPVGASALSIANLTGVASVAVASYSAWA